MNYIKLETEKYYELVNGLCLDLDFFCENVELNFTVVNLKEEDTAHVIERMINFVDSKSFDEIRKHVNRFTFGFKESKFIRFENSYDSFELKNMETTVKNTGFSGYIQGSVEPITNDSVFQYDKLSAFEVLEQDMILRGDTPYYYFTIEKGMIMENIFYTGYGYKLFEIDLDEENAYRTYKGAVDKLKNIERFKESLEINIKNNEETISTHSLELKTDNEVLKKLEEKYYD